MRALTAALCWLVAAAALGVAVPLLWLSHTVVDADGYTALARSAAADPRLQQAVSAEVSQQVAAYAADAGSSVDEPLVAALTASYVGGDDFADAFGEVSRIAHGWVFTDAARPGAMPGSWELDLGPMITDTGLGTQLARFGLDVPDELSVPVTVSPPDALASGRVRALAGWVAPVGVGAAALAALAAVATLAAARRRGAALAALGLAAVVLGALGSAGLALAGPRATDVVDLATGNLRAVAMVMVEAAQRSAQFWLTATMAVGGAAVVLGVALRGRRQPDDGARAGRTSERKR